MWIPESKGAAILHNILVTRSRSMSSQNIIHIDMMRHDSIR